MAYDFGVPTPDRNLDYLPAGEPFDLFKYAERYVRHNFPEPDIERPIRILPMPTIDSSKTIQGPILGCDEEYVKKSKKRKQKDLEVWRDHDEKRIVHQLSKIASYEAALYKLNPKKHRAKIVELNFKIDRCYKKLDVLQEETGIDLSKIDQGSNLMRFWCRCKRFFTKKIKKIKKSIKRNKKFIKNMLWIVVPGIIVLVAKRVLRV